MKKTGVKKIEQVNVTVAEILSSLENVTKLEKKLKEN